MKIKFECNKIEFENDYKDILRAFYPFIEIGDDGELIRLEISNIEENFLIVL